jgi:hypothetical protein
LLAEIKKAINDQAIKTWSCDKDGDFTHTPEQWANQAWFKPVIEPDSLVFGLLGKKDVVMTKLIHGLYHGRFIEMLLTHFDTSFGDVKATSQLISGIDNFKTN